MSIVQRITKNTGFLFLGDVISSLLGILLVVFLARYLGAAEYGKYAFAIAFASLFLILADMGLSVISIREIARNNQKASEYLTTISLIKSAFSLVMFGVIAITVNLLNYPSYTITIVYILGLDNILDSFGRFFRSIFRAFERMEYVAITRIIERVLVVGAALIALFQSHELMVVVLAILLAQMFSLLITMFLCIKKFTKPRLVLDLALAKHLIKIAIPFALTTIFASVLFQTDTVMLSVMKGDTVVGWYNAAYKPIAGILFLPTVFIGSIFPVLSRYYITAKDSLVTVYEKSLKLLATLAAPIGIGIMLIAGRIILFLYGEEFANSVIVLQILAWSVSLIFIVTLFGHTLASINRQVVDMGVVGFCALLNIVLNFSLIPSLSYTGAAIASLISQAVVFTIEFTYLQKRLYQVNLVRIVAKPLIAALIMGVLVYVLDHTLGTSTVNLFVIIFGAVISYGLLLHLFKALDRQEIAAVKDMFRRQTDKGNSI